MPAAPPTIAVLTALPLEYMAVRAHLTNIEKRVHPDYGTRAEVGQLPGTPWQIALLEMGEGTGGAAALTERVMTWFTPQAVLFVGVAGGLKDDIQLGDVVIATKVYAVHGGKEAPDGFLERPETWPAPHHLDSAARQALRGRPYIHFKPIAAGDVVLADANSPLALRIRERFNDAVAIEMEGSGVAHAAHLAGTAGALIIRGISDKADAGKAEADARGSQPHAAARAAEAAIAVLHELEPKEREKPKGKTPPSLPPHGTHSPLRLQTTHPPLDPHSAHGPVPTAFAALPPRPLGFTGRSADLTHLLTHLAPAPSPAPDGTAAPALLISAVTGMGGIGKTALAIEAAHQACAKGWFPGGTLFVDLRGYDENPVTADQAVLALLDALGVRGTELPTTTARQYDAYRACLSERRPRTLLILDNASDPSQFLPLLPGTGHHRVLITSRDRPDSLHLRVVDLEPLPEDHSTALVSTALSNDPRDDRPSREPDALRELTLLCGHLPLALQIAAAMLRRRRHRPIASLVAEIRKAEDPTAVLDNGDHGTDQYGRSLVLRPVLETSYRRLSPEQARLLRLLALAPGPDTGTDAVATLAELDIEPVLELLEDLAAAGLVTPVPRAGAAVRWRLHDLVRAFGAKLVTTDAALGEEGEAARERILVYYATLAAAANARMEWQFGLEDPGWFSTRAEALAWLDEERAGLVAAVQWAGEERFATAAGALAAALGEYLRWRRYFDDWIAVARAAHQAVCDLGRQEVESVRWSQLGIALGEAGRTEEAIEALTRARDTFPAAGQPHEEATVWNNLGNALTLGGRTEEAIVAHTRARDLCQAAQNQRGEAFAWSGLGNALRAADRMGEAVEAVTRARDMLRVAGKPHEVAAICSNLGITLHEAGRPGEAIEALTASLGICRELEDWYRTGLVLEQLAWIHEHTDVLTQARVVFLEAADAYGRANAPDRAARCSSWAEGLPWPRPTRAASPAETPPLPRPCAPAPARSATSPVAPPATATDTALPRCTSSRGDPSPAPPPAPPRTARPAPGSQPGRTGSPHHGGTAKRWD